MSASSLAIAGTSGGPCAECEHLDCISTRQTAQQRCRACHKPIGYDSPFYSEPGAKIHADCLESEIAKKLKAGLPLSDTKFLTVEETAEMLRVEPATVRNWVSQEAIPFRKAGARTLFLLAEVLAWTLPETRKPRPRALR